MPPAQVAFNPVLTTTAAGSFSKTSEGYIQGTALNDPAIRNQLAGGYLSPSESIPMWGGVGISELIPGGASTPEPSLGGKIGRATNITASGVAPAAGALTGFSVFDQDHAMINTPQSPVPLAGSNMLVNFYRLGSGARIVVAMDPALISLQGDLITTQVSWDFSEQKLVVGVAAYPANVFTAETRGLVSGEYIATATTTTPHGIVAGDTFTVSGVTPAAYNGTFVALAGTTGSTIKYSVGTVDPGAVTVQGQLDAGGGFLPVRILDVAASGSMTVSYDPVTGFATWDRDGAVAVILI
jgi:hypothetical protein